MRDIGADKHTIRYVWFYFENYELHIKEGSRMNEVFLCHFNMWFGIIARIQKCVKPLLNFDHEEKYILQKEGPVFELRMPKQ